MSFFRKHLSVPGLRVSFTVNVLSVIFFLLTLGFAAIVVSLFGWTITTPIVIAVAFSFLGVVILNKYGYFDASRLIFCLVPIWVTFGITLVMKTDHRHSEVVYFDSRFILLAVSIFPAIVLEFEEKFKMAICVGSSLLCLIAFDPVHNALGIGYYQHGFTSPAYYYINYVALVAFVALVSGVYVLKWWHWTASSELHTAVQENVRVNEELSSRNEELHQQQAALLDGQRKLEEAYDLIYDQKEELEVYNNQLEKLIKEKSGDLITTNEELVKTNNELRQFSFTVSHNMRGPVARLLGLTQLMQHDQDVVQLRHIGELVQKSAHELDEVLRDLNTIIDIRRELYRVREKISIREEWDKALSLLRDQCHGVVFVSEFETPPYLFGIRPMVQSVIFNLLSNALKYRNPEIPLEVHARSELRIDATVIEIQDNGLGIDLQKQGEHIFKLYKRFHVHVPGKGMGLYLVRTQMDIMDGRVEVESEPNFGTTFRLVFPIPRDVEKQIFYENAHALLYYHAMLNNTVIVWKQQVTSEEYRRAFEVVLQTLKQYNTPGWIADLRKQGVIMPEDQQWFIESVLKPAVENGLKYIATIGFDDPVRREYFERMKIRTESFGVELRVFTDMNQAVEWMKGRSGAKDAE